MSGMGYQEARDKIVGLEKCKHMHPKHKENMTRSLINQAIKSEGQAAGREICKEINRR